MMDNLVHKVKDAVTGHHGSSSKSSNNAGYDSSNGKDLGFHRFHQRSLAYSIGIAYSGGSESKNTGSHGSSNWGSNQDSRYGDDLSTGLLPYR